jgi:hypothetical protein
MIKKPSPPNLNWPSKNPGKSSRPERGNNSPKTPSKSTPPLSLKKK